MVRGRLTLTHEVRRQACYDGARVLARRVIPAVAVALALALLSTGGATAQQVYLDPSRPVTERVDDLLRQMTLAEKVGQMDQILVTHVTGPSTAEGFGPPDPALMQSVLIDNFTGSLLAGGTEMPIGNTTADWATTYNTVQSYAIQHSRLRIPVLFGVDAVHGFSHPWDATLFPHQVGMGATWDVELAEVAGQVTSAGLRSSGWLLNFAPVQDVYRDNRWGRAYETWSEEPALAGALGAANVRGLQVSSDGLRVAATLKHLAGNSQSINGHDRVAGLLPVRYLQDVFLPSYRTGIDAGARVVMVSSSAVNGVPATVSRFLQTDLLRGRLGFDGVIISDFNDVQALATAYHVAPDLAGAIARAVNAGLDIAMWVDKPEEWQSNILADVRGGAISEARIDESVRRILTLKFEVGLFDQPCMRDVSLSCVDPALAASAASSGADVSLRAARESVVLLKNTNDVLPLSMSSRVLLTGPSADSAVNQLGGWTISWQGVSGSGHSCCEGPPGQVPVRTTTLLSGMRALTSNLVFAPDQDSALAATAGVDAIVVAVGERAYAEALGDDPAPALPADQKALISSLEATGKPVAIVALTGRPLGLDSSAEQNAAAILVGFQGSPEMGQALAEVLFGVVNPSGKLPVTWPSDADARAPFGRGGDFNAGAPSPVGDQPKLFDQAPSTAAGAGSGYNPLFSFGFGLSYTTFAVSDLAVGGPSADGTVSVGVTVTNTGARPGTHIVPIFVAQPVSETVVPPHRLVTFTRVQLNPGESRQVTLTFPLTALATTPGDIDTATAPRVQPGPYIVEIPNQVRSSTLFPPNGPLTAPFSVS